MKHQWRCLVSWIIGIGVIGCIVSVLPRAHRVLGPKFFCLSTEIDINSGSLRRTRFVFSVPIYQRYEQTALAKEIEKANIPKPAPRWVEAGIKAGIDDYYPRPTGGKLLKNVNLISSILESRPELVHTNSVR